MTSEKVLLRGLAMAGFSLKQNPKGDKFHIQGKLYESQGGGTNTQSKGASG